MHLWRNSKERIASLSFVTTVLVCAILIAFHAGPIAFVVFIFGWPILLGVWPVLERIVRTRHAQYQHEQGILPKPSTLYYTPPETIVHPKQDYVRHEQEPR